MDVTTTPLVIANDSVWMEGNALRQLESLTEIPQLVRAVGMPDLHAGPGIPIGVSVALRDVIHPDLIGSDAGCGVRVVALPRPKVSGAKLERRVRRETDGPVLPEVDPVALLQAAWTCGPPGLADLPDVPEALAEWAADEADGAGVLGHLPSGELPDDPSFSHDLGTVGGGNHFVELSRVASVVDRTTATTLGLLRGGSAVVAHSGSRALGHAVARRWQGAVLDDESRRQAYLRDLAGCLRYAATNRLLLAWRLLRAAGHASTERIKGTFDIIHNWVEPVEMSCGPAWLHRKGSAPGRPGEPTVVLGTRGTESWVMAGTGTEETLWSVAHGAGRRMARGEALEKIRAKHARAELLRTSSGGLVICDDWKLLYAEHPDAYKDIEPVIESLEEAEAARRVVSLLPIATVKR
ncbi:MAG: RtcB family protein [Acidobacteriota bacterium]